MNNIYFTYYISKTILSLRKNTNRAKVGRDYEEIIDYGIIYDN
jgi:hypothetical protein